MSILHGSYIVHVIYVSHVQYMPYLYNLLCPFHVSVVVCGECIPFFIFTIIDMDGDNIPTSCCFNDVAFLIEHGLDPRVWSYDIRVAFANNPHRKCTTSHCTLHEDISEHDPVLISKLDESRGTLCDSTTLPILPSSQPTTPIMEEVTMEDSDDDYIRNTSLTRTYPVDISDHEPVLTSKLDDCIGTLCDSTIIPILPSSTCITPSTHEVHMDDSHDGFVRNTSITRPSSVSSMPQGNLKDVWALVHTINLTERLNTELGATRHHYNGLDYYTNEWPVVEQLLFPYLREETAFDCFWNWHFPNPIPKKKGWHTSIAAYPPTGCTSFGVEYTCDFETVCGCPRMLRVLRSSDSHVFLLYLRNVPVRHACLHTLSKDKCSSTTAKGQSLTLHVGLQSYIREQSFNHHSGPGLTWGSLRDKAREYILNSQFLHCELPHLEPLHLPSRDRRKQCQHPRALTLLREYQRYSSRTDFLMDPPCTARSTKNGTVVSRYSDVYSNVASYLLEDGHTPLGCHTFTTTVDEQCRDFLRTCNTRFHGQIDGPETSGLEHMHEDLWVDNLYVQFKNGIENRAKLNLYQYNVIGFRYTRILSSTQSRQRSQSNPPTHKKPRGYLPFFSPNSFFYIYSQVFLTILLSRYIFYCIYASIASLLTHVTAAWKANTMGWMNYNMDVVHEIGRRVTNLNIFNVAVTDAKQVAHQVSCTVHLGREGFVYEGTSACIMSASRYTFLVVIKLLYMIQPNR